MQYWHHKPCTDCGRLMSADDAHRKCQRCRNGGVWPTGKQRRIRVRRWLLADLAFLREHYRKRGPTWCAERIARPVGQVKTQAWRMGLTGDRQWHATKQS